MTKNRPISKSIHMIMSSLIPRGVKCTNSRNQTRETPQEVEDVESFLIFWQNDYIVTCYEDVILTTINQKQQLTQIFYLPAVLRIGPCGKFSTSSIRIEFV
ncbi:hypothetical protein Glove_52g11 [Diversispora epigaea]|uniref:Uncharacterized protein n=1 Tax=Diversispora epigaea TaxID=1348612 RepID=A0A397JE29_9GLOM|nr:hypothetical protein Glove_52g11 [Diversispora epigaea]